MEKYDFIKLMLQNRNLSVNDKKRLVYLATKELENSNKTTEDVPKDTSTKSDQELKHRYLSDGTRYVDSANLYNFLFRFNQDSVLRYTCHEIDTKETINEICEQCGIEKYDVESHAKLINAHFEKLISDLKQDSIWTDKKMFALISAYLTGKVKDKCTDWSSLQIKTNWCSKDLFNWSKSNPGKVPSPGQNIQNYQQNWGYELNHEFKSNINGKRVCFFNELVIHFKSLFHIRRDNSLYDILKYVNEHDKTIPKAEIFFNEKNFSNKIELLTDVDKLIQAYISILKICDNQFKKEKRQELVKIELSFYEENGKPILSIHHINSIFGKTLTDAKTRLIGDQFGNLIKNKINGICDLFIEADFGNNEYARLNVWNKQPKIEDIKLDTAVGVKYLLIFNQKLI